ncbi:MAG: hypothetical protein A3F73_12800 [Gallionellales bacterium RIFCSPLOWO2_12_FULL_59_22]|nr:MAG: hypothetical protein A3H99_05160 [Gallionellales bacterium RIFCSPLOWO2_02_FULL_59_110]OGT04902.1 MAG: hypothetical protein A2Z65_06710 [Gallionellales bacterium RIFCSPLOWO2_02_58_13]OGT12865.1 MAG: hypothetical protein A3F73_12800 [Gallionellales bacterium RIFCSPLOWO2_12_FULL_59_22]
MGRYIALFSLLMLPFSIVAAPPAGRLAPGTPYYFDSFDAGQRPWEPGQGLNIEEVFKNYEYYEIVLDRDGNGLTVNHYVSGSKAGSEKYRVLPDGSLQKNEP